MDIYARWAREYMAQSGATAKHFAMVSAKNSRHGAMNPRAQFQSVMTVEEILNARIIADPLTLPMCSPIGDGAVFWYFLDLVVCEIENGVGANSDVIEALCGAIRGKAFR